MVFYTVTYYTYILLLPATEQANRSSLLLGRCMVGAFWVDGKTESLRGNSEGVVVPLLQHEALAGHCAPLNMHSSVLLDEQAHDGTVCVVCGLPTKSSADHSSERNREQTSPTLILCPVLTSSSPHRCQWFSGLLRTSSLTGCAKGTP